LKKVAHIVLTFFAMLIFASCANTTKVQFEGNESVGDSWEVSSITPEGVVREVSNKYRIALPFPGMGGTFTIMFQALAEGEAEIILSHYFRGRKTSATTYTAVVDQRKRLTLTETGSYGVDMADEIRGTWYNEDSKTAVRFLEDLMQFAFNVENAEHANFENFGTYTVDWDTINVTTTVESTNGDASYTDKIGYTLGEYANGRKYIHLFTEYARLSGSFIKQ
jgi:hypothetical protein